MQARTIIAVTAALAMVTLASTEVWAQGGSYGGGVIAPGSPPIVLSGQSGGPRNANSMGSSCRGNIAFAPDHVFNVVAPMQVTFTVLNQGGDTTMIVMGPSGVFCDDDSAGSLRPQVSQMLMPGQYQVFIGTYGGGGMHPYTLRAMGSGGGPPPPQPVVQGGGGRYGGAVIGGGQMYANLSGASGGPISARTYGGACRGWVAGIPDHVITVTTPSSVTFDVTASGDTTLVITGPTGVLCNDDGGNGSNPRISGFFAPGRYEVRVGSYSQGRNFPYSMSIHP
jgi:hypothetical protein